jgi:hypothetical protein
LVSAGGEIAVIGQDGGGGGIGGSDTSETLRGDGVFGGFKLAQSGSGEEIEADITLIDR